MYDGTGSWPQVDNVTGGKKYSWSNIRFPNDRSLTIPNFESDTYIAFKSPIAVSISHVVTDVKTRAAQDIADAGTVVSEEEHQRLIETFKIQGYSIVKVTVKDADMNEKRSGKYSCTKISKVVEKATTQAMSVKEPDLIVIRWVAAQTLLARAGQIGGRTDDYFQRARDLAHQQLYLNPDLEATVRESISNNDVDPDFQAMLDIVTEATNQRAKNNYHQSQRNDCAASNGILYHIKDTDLVMVLDKNAKVIAFQFSNAFQLLLGQEVMEKTVQAFETYSTLQALPTPDMTRHGAHWIEWLLERPDLDFRREGNDPRLAKSGVYHFGATCEIGDSNGAKGVNSTLDSETRLEGKDIPETAKRQPQI